MKGEIMLFANEEQIKKYEKLKEKVKYYAEKYYTENISEISDQEYDFLYKELEKIILLIRYFRDVF